MKLKLLTFALTLALAGYAATTGDDKKPDAKATAKPDGDKPGTAAVSKVEMKLMVIFGGHYTFTADGVNVTKEVLKWSDMMDSTKPHVPQKTEAKPDKKAWDEFWSEVGRLELSTWKQKYEPDDTIKKTDDGLGSFEHIAIYDGLSWSLKVTTPKGIFESAGSNAYATIGQPGLATLKSDSVDALDKAFDELVASSAAPSPARNNFSRENLFDHIPLIAAPSTSQVRSIAAPSWAVLRKAAS